MFKYCTMWSKDPDFMGMVARAWEKQIDGTPMYRLVQKLKAVKQVLKKLHRSEFAK